MGAPRPGIKTQWKFNETFKAIFLDIWYEKSPESFTQAHKACDKVGNDMIIWLSKTNTELYNNIYKQTLEETKEEIIAQRLEGYEDY